MATSSRESIKTKPVVVPSGPVERPEAIAPAKTAEDIERLLIEYDLPGWRGGPVVWAWIVAVPILWVMVIMSFLSGEWLAFWPSLLALLTGRTVTKMSSICDARDALQLPELDRKWLGPLIEALIYTKGSVRSVARHRLLTVLPTAERADADSLSPGRRALLYDHLTPSKAITGPDLLCAILRFGAAMGDEMALAGTDQLAGMTAYTSAQRRVRVAARACLPMLERSILEQAEAGFVESANSRTNYRIDIGTGREISAQARMWLDEAAAEPDKRPGMRFVFLLASWGVIVPYTVYQAVIQWRTGSVIPALFFTLVAIWFTQLHRFALTPNQARMAGKLASVDDVQAVGALTEMTSWPDDRIRSMAIAALVRLLPRVKASDTQLLSPDQRTQLYQWLRIANANRHAVFQIALLGALEQVGDTAALPYVRALAGERSVTLPQQNVIDAAIRCLPFLEECAQHNSSSQVLLRPITDQTHDANLLRSAKPVDIDPDQLVRVASPPGTA